MRNDGWAMALLLGAAAAACGGSTAAANGQGTIEGWVCLGPYGTPSAGALVTAQINGQVRSTTAGQDGSFTLTGVAAGDGVLVVTNRAVQEKQRVNVGDGGHLQVGAPCQFAPASLQVRLCVDGSLQPEVATEVTLAYLDFGGASPAARAAVTLADGRVSFSDLVPGRYRLAALNFAATLEVPPGNPMSYDEPGCHDPALFGIVTGRICDPTDGAPVSGIPVSLTIDNEPKRNTATDDDGLYWFYNVPPGTHTLAVEPPLQPATTVPVVVQAGQSEEVSSPCSDPNIPNPATLVGTACVGVTGAHPLAGASVEVDYSPGVVSATAGLDGDFSLANLPAGTPTVTIRRGSWFTSFQVTLVENQTLDIGMTRCVGAGTRVAVVVGPYDNLVSPFLDLDLPIRRDASGAILDANGVVDLIDGAIPANAWVDDFAANLANLEAYDIIILSSGLNLARLFETDPCGLPPANDASCAGLPGVVALENLEAYLNAGGALYVSDWAYDVMRRQFPQYINFYDNDFIRLRALCGHAPHAPTASIVDESLALLLGGGTAVITYETDYAYWAVIAGASAQPNPYLKIFLVADVPAYTYINVTDEYCKGNAGIVVGSPLLVATPVGTGGGRVVFSTFRYTTAGDNAEIIRQVLLEL